MPELMSQAQLVADHKASLNDAASVFVALGDGDFQRHLATAALALGEKRARTLVGSIALVADQADYAAPALFLAFKSHLWGIQPVRNPQPWEKGHVCRLPDVRTVETDDDPVTRKLYLDPAPTAADICALGSTFKFYYRAGHSIDADAKKTTVQPADRGLLLLRAQVEALKEMALRNVMKPVMVREGLSSQPRNGTATFLWQELLKEYREAA